VPVYPWRVTFPENIVVRWSATLPELTIQGFGSMPMRSFTADEIRWVQPR
jgi:hypothetical protein